MDSRIISRRCSLTLALAGCCAVAASTYAETTITSSTAKPDEVITISQSLQNLAEQNDGRQSSLWRQQNASFNLGLSPDNPVRWDESDREQAADHGRTWWFSGNYHF